MSDPLSIDVFWSFRSPWSYLATPRLAEWQQRYALDVNFRPVYPIAIRTPEFFDRVHALWPSYFMRDVFRVAEFLGLPFQPPRPDPVVQAWADGKARTGPDQPHIYRLTRLGVVAQELSRGIEFANEVSLLIWGGTDGWNQGDHMQRAAERAGLALADLEKVAEEETDRVEAVIERNQVDHEAAGHWGVPTCVFEGEPFFGQDRLDLLLWRLRQHGLKERS